MTSKKAEVIGFNKKIKGGGFLHLPSTLPLIAIDSPSGWNGHSSGSGCVVIIYR